MRVAAFQIIGVMVLHHGKAAFDRGDVIAQSRTNPDECLEVRCYAGRDELSGRPLDRHDVEALVRAEQAILFDAPVDAVLGAFFWVLRANFADRDTALDELRDSGALLSDRLLLPDRSRGYLVREHQGTHDLRDRWAERARRQAICLAKAEQWEQARDAAAMAFLFEQSMSPDSVAVLSLINDRLGNAVRARDYVDMANNLRGTDFTRLIDERRAELETELRMSEGLTR